MGRPGRSGREGPSGRRDEFVCGVHAVLAALERGSGRVAHLHIAEGRTGEPAVRARELADMEGIPVSQGSMRALDGLVGTSQHQGLAAKVHPTPILEIEALLERQPPDKPPIVLLDGIQDPHNLGAILRTALALGAGGAVWPRDAAADLTPAVSKAAAGAIETLPLARVTNMVRAITFLKEVGYWIIAGDPEGEVTLGQGELPRPAALVVGREGKGVRPLVLKNCDIGVRIPLTGGIVESLNVSVAAGILLFALISPGPEA